MKPSAVARRKLRRWSGAVSVSVGTAVFSGAVGILVDRLVRGGSLQWAYLAAFTAAGVLISGGGAWLLATVRSAVGISLAVMDHDGDLERYQGETSSVARFGGAVFTAQTSVSVSADEPGDLLLLRARLLAALHILAEMEPRARQTGLLFQGRHQIGFHVGCWLNRASGRLDLYGDARDGGRVTHFAAIRLTPAIGTPPAVLDMTVHRRAAAGFEPAQPASLAELPGLLADLRGTCLGLAVNLNGPIGESGVVEQVLRSAAREDASAVVFVALPAPPGDPDAPGRQLAASRTEYESVAAAIVATAKRMPASPGLLYLKTPVVMSVAVGRYLYGSNWIPMRHRPSEGSYSRFAEPRAR
jgi:hypothetical protein